ncbi:hypothetical protein RJ639_004908 [Escallonia herrerae]|uniref:Uncharacterized protein n=1 Tax=Escallonia herrerae TaxID=1293975 RepID=A0AA88WB32_9ASTE|nr:hypothetical protein RJ639_004908 [Escallonia herrerae]
MALIKFGGRHTSKSMLFPPSSPGYNVTFPSNLFAYPLRIATAFPSPNSLPYMSNRDLRPCIEEMPEGAAISNRVVDGTSNEDAIYQLCHLNC